MPRVKGKGSKGSKAQASFNAVSWPRGTVGKAGVPEQERSQRLAILTGPDRWANGGHQTGSVLVAQAPVRPWSSC